MRAVAILVSLLAAACAPAAQQENTMPESPNREALLQIIDDFFIALGSGDADAFEALHSPGATSVIVAPENDEKIRYRTIAQGVIQMRGDDFPKIRERYWDPIVLERSGLALVWTPYSIDVDGTRLHCGVDVFNLSKHDSGWKIDSVNYTMEPTACDDIKPGEASRVRPDFSILNAKEN